MATPAAVLSILIKADTKTAQASLVKANRSLKATAGRMDDTDKAAKRAQKGYARITTAAYAAGGGLVVAGLAAKKAFREFEEAEKATQQTRAVLKSTGDAAKVTAREVENLAQKLSLKSGIDDEAIQSGENLLLTFTKIRNETGKGNQIFTRATSTIVDMSVALGQDLKSSAIQVGKALQDPEKGITALRRVGVAFTSQQEDRIQKWVEEGQILRAQRRILKELTVEFGGSAAAQATGAEKLRVAFDNLFEAFGKAFGPTLEKGFERLAGGLQKVGDIISNPRLTNAEKFGRVMDMIVRQIEKALPKVADAGVKVAGALATGFARAWINMNPLAKLFTLGVLLRVIGGRGAILAAGGAIGKMFGAAFGTGAAAAVGPGAKNAGAKGGTAFLGGFRGILGKLGVAGLVAALFGPEVYKRIQDAGTHADAAGVEFEFAAERMKKLQKAGNMGGLVKAARDAQYTAKQIGAAGAPLKALADRMEFVGDASKRLRERLERMRNEGARSVKELANRVQYNTGVIAQVMDKNSQRGKEAMGRNFAAAAQNVRLMMKAGTVSVKQGTKLIEQYMVKALQTMGFSKKEALMVRKGQDPYTGKATGGSQNLTGKQRGGPIQMGAATGDSVPAMLERGEYVLNRNAVSKVGRQNLDRVNFQNAPRFQGGGIVELLHPGNDPEGHGDHLHVAMETSAQIVALGKKLQRLGWIVGEHPAFGPVGGHVAGSHHYSGTAIDVNWPDAGQEAAKIAALLPMLQSGQVSGTVAGLKPAQMLKRLTVDGPDSMLKGTVQGALDITVGGANAVLTRANTLVTPEGTENLAAGVGSGPNQRMGLQMMLKLWDRSQWPALQELWTRESGWSETATNPSSGAYGIPQSLPASKMGPAALGSGPDAAKAQIAWGLNYIKGRYGNPAGALAFHDANNWYQKGGPVGYAGDSLGVGTVGPLRGIFGKDRNLQAAVSGGKNPQWGLGALKGLGKKKSQYVFDFGSNVGGMGIVQALRQANQFTGQQPLHTFTLNAGETAANKQIRGMGGNVSVIDWANKHGALGDGLHGDYGHRARLLNESIERAAKANTKPNKPKGKGKLNKRKHLSGLQAPSLQALHTAVEGMRYGRTEEGRANALHRILDLVRGTSLPQHLTDRIEGLTEQALIAGDYADRAGQLTTEDSAGNIMPGAIGGKTEIDFLADQLGVLAVLRNRLVEAQEKLAARRAQIRELLETAQKHFDYYQKAVVAWGHAIRVQEAKLEELRKHPKKNKKQIEATRNLIMAIKPEQAKNVSTRDALKDKIIPALKGKHGTLGENRSTMLDSLAEVQGVGSPLTQMATLPTPGTLGGSIFDVQMRLRELKMPPEALTDTLADTLTSDRDELLKEIGRLTLQRTRVEAIHEITLRDFPDFSALGVPLGGKFHTGGIVPGPVGTETATVLQGGEGVFTRDQMAAMGSPSVTINVAPGMEWLKQFISVEVDKTTRRDSRRARRGLPGGRGIYG